MDEMRRVRRRLMWKIKTCKLIGLNGLVKMFI